MGGKWEQIKTSTNQVEAEQLSVVWCTLDVFCYFIAPILFAARCIDGSFLKKTYFLLLSCGNDGSCYK